MDNRLAFKAYQLAVKGEHSQIIFVPHTKGAVVRTVEERYTTFTKHLGFTNGQALTRIGYELGIL